MKLSMVLRKDHQDGSENYHRDQKNSPTSNETRKSFINLPIIKGRTLEKLNT